jgi:hypothetical protein
VRQQLLLEWAENAPPGTGMTSKVCHTTEYKQRMGKGSGANVVNRYEKSLLREWGTT